MALLLQQFAEGFAEQRHDGEEVADDTVRGHLEDGGFGSLLMATMTSDEPMPARCWIWPLMPQAM